MGPVERIACAVSCLFLPLVGGCSLGVDVDMPDWARVTITSSSSLDLEVQISQKFLVSDGTVQLLESSTETVSLPFEKNYALGAPARFFIRVRNITDGTASFHLKVELEKRVWVDGDKVVAPGEQVEFVYRYDEPVLNP